MIRKNLLFLLLLGFWSNLAYAQDAATISSAREAAKSGIEDYYAGRYDAAHDKLSRAFAVVRVPTLALFNARALAKTAKLVEAAEFYLLAMRLPTGEGDAETQEQARRDARTERTLLLQRVPRLRILVTGVTADKVSVQANDVKVLPSLFATGWMVNPGTIRVVGTSGGQRVEAVEVFAEGENKAVTLAFQGAPAALQEPVAMRPHGGVVVSNRSRAPAPSSYRVAAWTSLGIGAVGVAFGGATGVWALVKKSDLDSSKACDGSSCEGKVVGGEVDKYNRLRNLSTVGFVVAAAGGVTAAVLYLNEPKANPKQAWTVSPWVGVASAGLGGTFQ